MSPFGRLAVDGHSSTHHTMRRMFYSGLSPIISI